MTSYEKKSPKPKRIQPEQLKETILQSVGRIQDGTLTIIKQDNQVIQINTSKKINLL